MYRRLTGEFLGTAFLMAAVTGCAAMTAQLAMTPGAALAICAACSGLALFVMLTIFAPVSGGHLNPAVTLAFLLRREISGRDALAYGVAQAIGAVAGVMTAHLMFALPLTELSQIDRSAPTLWLSEAIATFGLIVVILGGIAAKGPVPALVGAYIAAGYWFTASTAFTNPAMTLARILTGTAAGLRPEDLAPYLAAQFAGALAGALLGRWLFAK